MFGKVAHVFADSGRDDVHAGRPTLIFCRKSELLGEVDDQISDPTAQSQKQITGLQSTANMTKDKKRSAKETEAAVVAESSAFDPTLAALFASSVSESMRYTVRAS